MQAPIEKAEKLCLCIWHGRQAQVRIRYPAEESISCCWYMASKRHPGVSKVRGVHNPGGTITMVQQSGR